MSEPDDSHGGSGGEEEEDPFTSPGFKALEDPVNPRPEGPDDVTLRDAMPPEGIMGEAILAPPSTPRSPALPGFRLATDLPATPIIGRSGPDAVQLLPQTKKQHDVTRPMSPIPGHGQATEPFPDAQLQSASRHLSSRAAVLAPDPKRVFPQSLPQLQALSEPAQAGGEAAARAAATRAGRRRLSIVVLAVVMFLACFVGTGGMILWVTSQDAGDEGGGGPGAGALPAPPASATAAQGTSPPLTKLPTPVPPRPVQPPAERGDGRQRAQTLLRLGDEEAQRIRPFTDVLQSADLDRAIAVPQAHYDAAQEHYREASRHDSAQLQCALVHMGASAEQLASALDETAEAPQVLAVAPERFTQELHDRAANYRAVARRNYQRALGQSPSDDECQSLAQQGLRRTTAALGLTP